MNLTLKIVSISRLHHDIDLFLCVFAIFRLFLFHFLTSLFSLPYLSFFHELLLSFLLDEVHRHIILILAFVPFGLFSLKCGLRFGFVDNTCLLLSSFLIQWLFDNLAFLPRNFPINGTFGYLIFWLHCLSLHSLLDNLRLFPRFLLFCNFPHQLILLLGSFPLCFFLHFPPPPLLFCFLLPYPPNPPALNPPHLLQPILRLPIPPKHIPNNTVLNPRELERSDGQVADQRGWGLDSGVVAQEVGEF